jgi:hypothetical protein
MKLPGRDISSAFATMMAIGTSTSEAERVLGSSLISVTLGLFCPAVTFETRLD